MKFGKAFVPYFIYLHLTLGKNLFELSVYSSLYTQNIALGPAHSRFSPNYRTN